MRFCLSLLLLTGSLVLFAQNTPSETSARAALQQLNADVRIAGTSLSVELREEWSAATVDPPAAARTFLEAFGAALGTSERFPLEMTQTQTAADGATYVRFHQRDDLGYDAPVLGSGVTVRVSPSGAVSRVGGKLLPATFLAPASAPTVPHDYVRSAQLEVLGEFPHAEQWAATDRGRIWVSPDPLRPTPERPARRCRQIDLDEPGGYRALTVYVDEATGKPVFSHQRHCDLNRNLFHEDAAGNQTLRWTEGNNYPGSLSANDQQLLNVSAETHNLMFRTFGRNGYDGQDGAMRIVSIQTNCGNAFSSGGTISFCQGFAVDDVIAHEWMHSYISEMSDLIYFSESGAVNEGFADIFGEVVDLLNSSGNDSGENTARSGCTNSGRRWLLGEDLGGNGIRDMWTPECQSDPGSIGSDDFFCGSADRRGVHINSGLVNRTFSLLVDGGTLNGTTVSGIGLTKATHIFYHAQDVYLTRVSGFADLGRALTASAQDLQGVNLRALTIANFTPGRSGQIISTADRQQVAAAVRATGLLTDSPCGDAPALAQNPPATCSQTTEESTYVELLRHDWESGMGSFTSTEVASQPSTWNAKPWFLESDLPAGRAGRGIFIANSGDGDCRTDLDNGVTHLTGPSVALPVSGTDFRLEFDHYFSTERGYDGGILQMSRNGGAFSPVDNSAFLYNGYSTTLVSPGGNDNPLAGLMAFSGANQNTVAGTWGTSQVDLSAAGAQPGDNIRLRWTMGHDGCTGWFGWALDEIRVGYCEPAALPVTYLEVAARPVKDHIAVTWATSDELDNYGFFVERRRADAGEFQELGFVRASGTRSGAYAFDDHTASGGVTYLYRLRQQDFDGTTDFSPLVRAELTGAENLLGVYPNPAITAVNVRATAADTEAVLYDLAGRRVQGVGLNNGMGVLPTSDLRAGIYLLRVGERTRRVVIR